MPAGAQMSQGAEQWPATPAGYGVPSGLAPRVRPAAVGFVAYLGIAVGAMLLACNVLVFAAESLVLLGRQKTINAGMPPLDPVMAKFGAANAVSVLLFALVLVGASFAALALRPAARLILLGWSIGFILLGAIHAGCDIAYVGPATLDWVRRYKSDDPTFASGQMAALIVPRAIGVMVLYFILPALYLVLLNRRDVRQAFATPARPENLK